MTTFFSSLFRLKRHKVGEREKDKQKWNLQKEIVPKHVKLDTKLGENYFEVKFLVKTDFERVKMFKTSKNLFWTRQNALFSTRKTSTCIKFWKFWVKNLFWILIFWKCQPSKTVKNIQNCSQTQKHIEKLGKLEIHSSHKLVLASKSSTALNSNLLAKRPWKKHPKKTKTCSRLHIYDSRRTKDHLAQTCRVVSGFQFRTGFAKVKRTQKNLKVNFFFLLFLHKIPCRDFLWKHSK